jgi:hypothetical protein
MYETPKAAAAYAEYAAMGPERSLRKLAEGYSNPSSKLRLFSEWSSAHQWQERVKEHDTEIIAAKEARQLADIERMNERQAVIGTTQQTRALKEIERLLQSGEFSPQAAVRLLKLAIDVERTARGAPTGCERIEQTGKDGGPIELSDARSLLAAKLAAQAECTGA